jgi:hypothetical protein
MSSKKHQETLPTMLNLPIIRPLVARRGDRIGFRFGKKQASRAAWLALSFRNFYTHFEELDTNMTQQQL